MISKKIKSISHHLRSRSGNSDEWVARHSSPISYDTLRTRHSAVLVPLPEDRKCHPGLS
jgi:hypothetical protein